jgi:ATP-dependent Lon protease
MSDIQSAAGWPNDFCGKVRLFPLPSLVLFPHVVQPLHIFEPRYCDMLFDALSGDKLIAMALLETGWEDQYMCKPKIAPTVCVGKIISHTPTDDGRHNILLVGMKRGQIRREMDTEHNFRQAEVEIFEDEYPSAEAGLRSQLTERLQELFSHFVPEGLAAQESFKQLVGKQLPLGILTDTITYALNLPIAIKLQLLAEKNVDIRCRILIRCLEQQLRVEEGANGFSDDFPPKFSEN